MPVKFVFDDVGNLLIRTRLRPLAEIPTDQEMLDLGKTRVGAASTEGWHVIQVSDETYRAVYKIAVRITRDVGTGELVVVPREVTPVSVEELIRQTRVKEIGATTSGEWSALTTEQKTTLMLEYFEKAILGIA
ncbi:MAG TPA: hypothetical protein PKW95_22525 [bacterium]|nr:hypothetical protein [bacterium]